jgi:hypothetical protein
MPGDPTDIRGAKEDIVGAQIEEQFRVVDA